jgi:ketosteroid isomerase-like protein
VDHPLLERLPQHVEHHRGELPEFVQEEDPTVDKPVVPRTGTKHFSDGWDELLQTL